MMWFERKLSHKEVLLFFLVLSFIYVYPIIHADYAYIDDNWRALLGAQDGWRNQGRILMEWFHELLTFGGGTINIFPLPLLLSIFVLVIAMSRLTLWYFPEPTVASGLVVLPILCNPFFLGNLTYQYDGPAMILAVVAVIYAMTCRIERASVRSLVVALLIAVTLSLYQLTIALFIGLCVVEFYLGISKTACVREVLSGLAQRAGQLIGGGTIYFLTAYQLAIDPRGNLYPFDEYWFEEVSRKFFFSMDKVGLLVTPGNKWLCALIIIIALVGFVFSMRNIPRMKGGRLEKGVLAVLYLLCVPVLVFIVPGGMLFLREGNLDARNYIAFAAVMIFLFVLNYEVLGRVNSRLRGLLVVPVLFTFSFSYAYGQIIIAKKELESALAQYVAYDLISHDELRNVQKFYYVGPRVGANWLPRGHAAITHMPLLRYILSDANAPLHPQFMTRLGINNVVAGNREVFNAGLTSENKKPVVDRKLYSIYLSAGDAFIVMKDFDGSEDYNHH